ncbi:MAG: DNA recombination protein RmuC [Phycisphaerales bacterium]|nr:DNA recombination protein RmuC [Phycisphaerales bacterium]
MDLVAGVLMAGFFLAAGAAVWLAVERGKCAAALAVARSEREAAVQAVAAGRTEVAAAGERIKGLLDQVEMVRARVSDQDIALTRLRGQVEKGDEVHREREAAFARREAELKRSIGVMTEDFKAVFGKLSGDALRNASEQFLTLAESRLKEQQTESAAEMDKRKAAVDELIRPMGETLRRTEEKIAGLSSASADLRAETGKLVRALSRPEVRGRYGEMQLRRVAELAGMVAYCDFTEQASVRDADGRLQRPDMIVNMPSDHVVAVDAKCNIDAYVKAAEATDEAERERLLARFAEHVGEQVAKLSGKSYWSAWDGSAELVVMFVPGDQFLDAALSRCPELMERAAERNVILATPSTLIGLLRAVAVGWREKRIEEQARELFRLGKELHERAAVAFGKVADLGAAIDAAARKYNAMVGSVESRLLPSLRKFEEGGVSGGKELPELPEVTTAVREPVLFGVSNSAEGVANHDSSG